MICLQNHDQIGNRALGERLHHQIDPAAYRAASVLLLMAPETPLLFMGQEWAASTPFLYFTDHHAELGRLVTEGRRDEFRHFAAFSDPLARAADSGSAGAIDLSLQPAQVGRTPRRAARLDAQAVSSPSPPSSARASPAWRVDVSRGRAGRRHHRHPAGRTTRRLPCRRALDGGRCHRSRGWPVRRACERHPRPDGRWELVLSSEDPAFSPDPSPPDFDWTERGLTVRFLRPSAVVLRREREENAAMSQWISQLPPWVPPAVSSLARVRRQLSDGRRPHMVRSAPAHGARRQNQRPVGRHPRHRVGPADPAVEPARRYLPGGRLLAASTQHRERSHEDPLRPDGRLTHVPLRGHRHEADPSLQLDTPTGPSRHQPHPEHRQGRRDHDGDSWLC